MGSEKLDFNKMSLKDMERVKSTRKVSFARNMSIKYKIAAVTIIVALIPMTLLTCLMLFFYNRAIMQRGNKQIEENIRIMADRISSVIDNGEICSNNLTLEFSDLYNDRSVKQVTRDSKIISQLSQSKLIYNGISSIVFLDDYGAFYATDRMHMRMGEEIRNSSYLPDLEDTRGKTVLMDISQNVMDRDDKEVITLGKRVINTLTGQAYGYLFINIDKNYLIESSSSEISYYFLYDDKGNCISEKGLSDPIYSEKELIDSLYLYQNKILKYNNETYLLSKSKVKGTTLTIVGITNLNRFNVTGKDLRFILLTTLSLTAVLLLTSMIISANLVTRPLKVLHDGAEQIAEGDMSVRFRFKTKDEIGRLGRIFNYMTQRNLELLTQVDEEAKKKREYELSLIQEQVKPHFLYNTLDIIIMLIEMNRAKEASRVTKKLADYYKNSLSGSEEIVTVDREIQIITDYLDLQSMRYGDKFVYGIDVEDSIKSSIIPKMTLQPLVENAIYHGIKNKDGNGRIQITGRLIEGEEPYAELVVNDDGIGMDEKELSRINELLSDSDRSKESADNLESAITEHESISGGSHFGLYSVGHRIRLYFGDEYGVRVSSQKNVGTRIVIKIPANV